MDAADLGAQTAGVWTRRQAAGALTAGRVDVLLRTGTWQSPWPGVLADAGHVLTARQRAWAAVLASGDGAYACARTAARLHGLPLVDDDDPATGAREHLHDDVGLARSARQLEAGGRTLHRHQLLLEDDDLVRPPGGPPTTSVLRTLVDLARVLRPEALVCCVDDALHRGLVRPADLEAAVARRTGRRGGPALRAAVAAADGRAESPAETLLRLVLAPHFPALVPQVTVLDRACRPVARFDLGDETALVAVEADGKRGHAGALMVARDQRRDRRTRALGWTTERVTWSDLRCRPAEVVSRVAQAYAEQARRTRTA